MTERGSGPERGPSGGSRARLVDIASAVGVHPSTVSRVLNGNITHSIRPEVIEKIHAEASARGYRPNAMARALRERRTGALTFVVPLLRNPIWARLQRGALLRATERGYVVMIMEEPVEDPQPPGAYDYLVAESRADGLLIATALRDGPGTGGAGASASAEAEDDADNSKTRDKGQRMSVVPHVYVNRRGPDSGNNVIMDESAAVRMVVDHVADLGHRGVLLVDGPRTVDTVHRRVTTLRRHCAARGIRAVVRCTELTEKGGFEVVRRLLEAGPPPGKAPSGASQSGTALPTAIAVGSIEQVFGVLAALRAARVPVPGEVSLVSFDDDESLAYLDVPVTSVRMPLAELGAAAVDALIARIDGGTGPDGVGTGGPGTGGAGTDVLITAPITLVPRGSTGPPGAGRGERAGA